jgi:glycosyltransferase involved in cell wall biosynthesis
MKWTFWQNIISPHLSQLASALASLPNQTVTVVAWEELNAVRKSVGWQKPDCSPARVVLDPGKNEIDHLVRNRDSEMSIHLFGGASWGSQNRKVLFKLTHNNVIVGLISEAANNGLLQVVRRTKYRFERYFLKNELSIILAMGHLGVHWFEQVGYDSTKIFPFSYVTNRPNITLKACRDRRPNTNYQIVYLGQFIKRKDCITAMRALAGIVASNWRFNIIGNGPDLLRWRSVAIELGLEERIQFCPSVSNSEIGNIFNHTDLLLLPSKWDGWGAVVNEALMCGVPVVCSSNCGAADLLRETWRGDTFEAGSIEDLRCKLSRWIERGKNSDLRIRIQDWSHFIEGSTNADYLVEIIKYVQGKAKRPSPPWYGKSQKVPELIASHASFMEKVLK